MACPHPRFSYDMSVVHPKMATVTRSPGQNYPKEKKEPVIRKMVQVSSVVQNVAIHAPMWKRLSVSVHLILHAITSVYHYVYVLSQ